MGGARLSQGGLHLGHYLGCLTPLEDLLGDEYFFVIRDRGKTCTLNNLKSNPNIINMVSDLLSTSYANRISIVPQSFLHSRYQLMQDFILDILTLTQLQNAHPRKKRIKNDDTFNISLKDFLFPVETICTYFSLNAKYILMNDDSLRFVSFAKRVSQKLANLNGTPLVVTPTLKHGVVPRLLGYNYQKLSKGHNNCIFLSESDEQLAFKVKQLFLFKYLFVHEPEFKDTYTNSPHNFVLPKSFLPLLYLRAFGSDVTDGDLERYRNPALQNELENRLLIDLKQLIDPMREKKKYYINNPDECWLAIESGIDKASGVVKEIGERFEVFVENYSQTHG